MKHKVFALLAGSLFGAACLSNCDGSNPTGPTPTPTPPASASPTPLPPLRPLTLADLTPDLKAAVNCCSDGGGTDLGKVTGWPFYNAAVLDLYRRAGVRLTEVRLGPNNPSAPDPGPEDSLRLLDETARASAPVGLHIITGLYDSWPARHGFNYWNEDAREVMSRAPQAHHLAWVRQVVAVARRHPNVILMDGNETFVTRPSREWVEGLLAEARAAGYTGLLGTNSGFDPAAVGADFEVIHGWKVAGPGQVLLESDNRDHSVEDWLRLRASASGVTAFWRGPLPAAEWERLLLTETSSSCEPPPACPPAAKMGVEAFTCDDGVPYGGTCTLNLTPKFGNPPGRPCNDEHREVCSSACGAYRECEPVQPPVIRITGAVDSYRNTGNNPYLVNVVGVRGAFHVEACWPDGAVAPSGEPLDLSRSFCGELDIP
jgi:hypothetical protein